MSEIPREQILTGGAENESSFYAKSADFQTGSERQEKFDAAKIDAEISIRFLDLAEGMSDAEMEKLVDKAKSYLDAQPGSKAQMSEVLTKLLGHEENKKLGARTNFLQKLNKKYFN
jgi:hypothetical protein